MPGSENSSNLHYIYLLENARGQLYVGLTRDLRRRVNEHNGKKVFSTKAYIPWNLVYYEACKNEKDATRREKYLKTSKGSRLLKRRLKEYFYSKKT